MIICYIENVYQELLTQMHIYLDEQDESFECQRCIYKKQG